MKIIKNKTFFINTLSIIITGFLIKLLGLVNKIIMTRMLGTNGIRLYILSFPTIMMFVGISGMSMYITMSKLVAEANITRKYSPKKLLQKCVKFSVIISLFIDIIFIIFLKQITNNLLKDANLFYPLLTTVVLIPLVGISDGIKGYFNGCKMTTISSLGNLIEQIARITSSIIFLFIFLPKGVIIATTFCLLSLSIGEIFAIIFGLYKLKKHPPKSYPNTTNESIAILSMSIPNTISKLIGNITYFLEPILFTCLMLKQGYSILSIHTEYTIIDAYTIPLLTFISFLPMAISSSIIPGITQAITNNKQKSLHYYIRKVILFSIIPAIILSSNLYFFNKDYMNLIYKTNEGTKWIKPLTFYFLCYYIHIPVVTILQILGNDKFVFWTNTINNFIRLLLIFILSFNTKIGLNSIILSTTITMVLGFIIHLYKLIKESKFTINLNNLLLLTCISIITFCICKILFTLNINYLICLVISSLICLSLSIKYRLIWIESLFNKKKK